jgi:peptide-methionine (S)-S-oxide reductase
VLDVLTRKTKMVDSPFSYAEDYHQQYLAKNPNGYCGPGGTGVACPVGVAAAPVSSPAEA